jgi:hypothetical protein
MIEVIIKLIAVNLIRKCLIEALQTWRLEKLAALPKRVLSPSRVCKCTSLSACAVCLLSPAPTAARLSCHAVPPSAGTDQRMGTPPGGADLPMLEHDSRTELMSRPRLSKKHFNRVAALAPALLAFAVGLPASLVGRFCPRGSWLDSIRQSEVGAGTLVRRSADRTLAAWGSSACARPAGVLLPEFQSMPLRLRSASRADGLGDAFPCPRVNTQVRGRRTPPTPPAALADCRPTAACPRSCPG